MADNVLQIRRHFTTKEGRNKSRWNGEKASAFCRHVTFPALFGRSLHPAFNCSNGQRFLLLDSPFFFTSTGIFFVSNHVCSHDFYLVFFVCEHIFCKSWLMFFIAFAVFYKFRLTYYVFKMFLPIGIILSARKCHIFVIMKNQTPWFCLKRDLHFFEKDLHCKLIWTLSPKMFYCHTTFIERIKMFTFSGLSLLRPVDTKLTSIWATL